MVIDVPEDTGTTVYRLCPEGGGEDGWTASLTTLMPAEDVPARLSAGTTDSAVRHQPEYAPWDDPFDIPDPSPSLQARAERGLERFLRDAAADGTA
ncbi:hypothetical protein DRB96_26160 [Streptomyces sp. ICC1]|nr:hypothetical protein DRB89_01835 [Streptomyces sp. ICC4]AWZ15162.1 hypothetical protein DRB96_26160 [Streptomyces sp. ICC1]